MALRPPKYFQPSLNQCKLSSPTMRLSIQMLLGNVTENHKCQAHDGTRCRSGDISRDKQSSHGWADAWVWEKMSRIHPLGNLHACTKYHGNASNSLKYFSLDQPSAGRHCSAAGVATWTYQSLLAAPFYCTAFQWIASSLIEEWLCQFTVTLYREHWESWTFERLDELHAQ